MDETNIGTGVTEIPLLPLQWTWLHSCVALSCQKNQITVVVNGVKVLEKEFERKTPCPTSLDGNLLLHKHFVQPGIWSQNMGPVTNVNIFSGLMSEDKMVSRTSGEDCGKQDGDFLSWTNSSWNLEGSARWTEVPVEDLCREFSSIQLFSTYRVQRPENCRHLCENMHGEARMASVETQEQLDKLQSRVKVLSPQLDSDGNNFVILWLPVSTQKGLWLDNYTKRPIKSKWSPGNPVNDSNRQCAIGWTTAMINWRCLQTAGYGGFYCSCDFGVKHPFLTLRGLCKDSYLDQTYLPQNSPLDGETTFYGNTKSFASFQRDDSQWKIETNVFNTTAMSKEISGRFMLGKQTWSVEGDSKKCHEGKPYVTEFKLSSCEESKFTCDDGQCINIEQRCNQVPDCRDMSDERNCQLIVLGGDYNKNIPPIGRTTDGAAIPANVSISITLMKVVEIEEVGHSIHLQFRVNMQWRENRVKYQNLKDKTSLNALISSDVSMLWLPLVIYDNTDQKKSTRLGWINEWVTSVSVIKEGDFMRSGLEKVDEAEIFEGAENLLKMTQTYTHEFQCKYKLQRYPFDSQVNLFIQHDFLHFALRNVPSKCL